MPIPRPTSSRLREKRYIDCRSGRSLNGALYRGDADDGTLQGKIALRLKFTRNGHQQIRSSSEHRYQGSEVQGFAGSANLRKILSASKDFPECFGLPSDLSKEKGLGKNDTPRPDGKDQQNRQDNSGDGRCLAEDFEQVQLIQMRLLEIKNLTVRR